MKPYKLFPEKQLRSGAIVYARDNIQMSKIDAEIYFKNLSHSFYVTGRMPVQKQGEVRENYPVEEFSHFICLSVFSENYKNAQQDSIVFVPVGLKHRTEDGTFDVSFSETSVKVDMFGPYVSTVGYIPHRIVSTTIAGLCDRLEDIMVKDFNEQSEGPNAKDYCFCVIGYIERI